MQLAAAALLGCGGLLGVSFGSPLEVGEEKILGESELRV